MNIRQAFVAAVFGFSAGPAVAQVAPSAPTAPTELSGAYSYEDKGLCVGNDFVGSITIKPDPGSQVTPADAFVELNGQVHLRLHIDGNFSAQHPVPRELVVSAAQLFSQLIQEADGKCREKMRERKLATPQPG